MQKNSGMGIKLSKDTPNIPYLMFALKLSEQQGTLNIP